MLELIVKATVSVSTLAFLSSAYFLKKGAPERVYAADEKPVFVADEAGLLDPSFVKFTIGNTPGILVKFEGALNAFDASCTHMGCPVSGRSLDEGIIQCPCHGSTFDPVSGERIEGPASGPLRRLEIEIKEGVIYALPS